MKIQGYSHSFSTGHDLSVFRSSVKALFQRGSDLLTKSTLAARTRNSAISCLTNGRLFIYEDTINPNATLRSQQEAHLEFHLCLINSWWPPEVSRDELGINCATMSWRMILSVRLFWRPWDANHDPSNETTITRRPWQGTSLSPKLFRVDSKADNGQWRLCITINDNLWFASDDTRRREREISPFWQIN